MWHPVVVTHPSGHARLFEEFSRLCDASPEECGRRLAEVRDSDPSLADELSLLLAKDGEAAADRESLTAVVRDVANTVLVQDRRGATIGRFVLLDRIGEGGVGIVYAAFDTELERRVAVKLIRGGSDERSHHAARERWLEEARAMAKVAHPNLVTVFEAGTQDDEVFIVMEQVVGRTMRAWMHEIHATKAWAQGRATSEILSMLMQAARGLGAAHAMGVLHRDFKPDNVLIGDDGSARVADFGLARGLDNGVAHGEAGEDESSDGVASHTTGGGGWVGTPSYMSPEQFESKTLDARSDQFSFCVTAYEALFGVRPFEGPTLGALAVAVTSGQPRATPSTPPVDARITAALGRGLSRNPDDRFASMDALLDALTLPDRRAQARWTFAAGGLVALALLGWLAHDPSPLDRCDEGRQRSDHVWGAAQRVQMRSALTDPQRVYAPAVLKAVVQRLDAYTEGWTTAHRDACEATHVRGVQTDAILDARMLCLDRRLSTLGATVTALTSSGSRAIDRGIQLVDGLPSVAACADLDELQARHAEPDPQDKERVEGARRLLARATAALVVEDTVTALALVEAVAAVSDEIGYLPLSADVALARGQALYRADKLKDASAALQRAVFFAQEAGMDRVVRQAATRLGRLVGVDLRNVDQGLFWLRFAESTARRRGGAMHPEVESGILRNRAWVLVGWERRDGAVEVAQQSVAAAERILEPWGTHLAVAVELLGITYSYASKPTEAEAAFVRSRDLLLARYGPDHPRMLQSYMQLGVAQTAMGKAEAARENLKAAVAMADTLPGLAPSTRAMAHDALGSAWGSVGAFDEAFREYSTAVELQEAIPGSSGPMLSVLLSNLAGSLKGQGHYEEAIAALRRSLALREAAFGPEHVQMWVPLYEMGINEVLALRPQTALPFLERAERILEAHPSSQSASDAADQRFWLGRALFVSGEDRVRGRALALAAKEALEGMGDDKAGVVVQWLGDHAAP